MNKKILATMMSAIIILMNILFLNTGQIIYANINQEKNQIFIKNELLKQEKINTFFLAKDYNFQNENLQINELIKNNSINDVVIVEKTSKESIIENYSYSIIDKNTKLENILINNINSYKLELRDYDYKLKSKINLKIYDITNINKLFIEYINYVFQKFDEINFELINDNFYTIEKYLNILDSNSSLYKNEFISLIAYSFNKNIAKFTKDSTVNYLDNEGWNLVKNDVNKDQEPYYFFDTINGWNVNFLNDFKNLLVNMISKMVYGLMLTFVGLTKATLIASLTATLSINFILGAVLAAIIGYLITQPIKVMTQKAMDEIFISLFDVPFDNKTKFEKIVSKNYDSIIKNYNKEIADQYKDYITSGFQNGPWNKFKGARLGKKISKIEVYLYITKIKIKIEY